MENRHFQDWITLLVGILLVIAPFMLTDVAPEGTGTTPLVANFVASGAAAIILALAALLAFRQWEEWLDVVLGLWLIASPWVIGFTYAPGAVWTAVIAGVLIAGMGAWTTYEENREGHA